MKPLAWRATALYGAVTVALGALGPWLLAVQGAEEQNTSEHTSLTCKDYVLAERAGRTGLGGHVRLLAKRPTQLGCSPTSLRDGDVAARRGHRCATGPSPPCAAPRGPVLPREPHGRQPPPPARAVWSLAMRSLDDAPFARLSGGGSTLGVHANHPGHSCLQHGGGGCAASARRPASIPFTALAAAAV